MKTIDARIWIGAALIVLGALMFAERLGWFSGATDVFWASLFVAAALYFLFRLVRMPETDWWAAIPGLALAGLAAEILVPPVLGDWGGVFFLGSLGLAFFVVYLTNRQRWWALIPGGVLVTLAGITALEHALNTFDAGPVLFLGIGATFVLVALAASMRWAYIPGVALMAFGAILGLGNSPLAGYLWPGVLVACGLLLIWRFARTR